MDPMREVARIELKGNASTRVGKPRQVVWSIDQDCGLIGR